MPTSRRIRGFDRTGSLSGLGAYQRASEIGNEVEQLTSKIRQWASQETASVQAWIAQLRQWRSDLTGLMQDERVRSAFGAAIDKVLARIDDEIERAKSYITQMRIDGTGS